MNKYLFTKKLKTCINYKSQRNYATNAIIEHMLLHFDILHCTKFMNGRITFRI